MAFVRWRGGCSQLIATVYEDGRSRQITLANLPDFYVSENTKHHVAQKFPKISVDWSTVDRELARGTIRVSERKHAPQAPGLCSRRTLSASMGK